MSDEYEHVARSKLKLKTDSSKISKKKKKDKKNREKLEREHEQHKEALKDVQSSAAPRRTMTKAELSFKKMQEKMVSTSHSTNFHVSNRSGWQLFNVMFCLAFTFSKRNVSWRRHRKRTSSASRNSTNI